MKISLKTTFIFLGVYILIRIVSFIFPPATPLYGAHVVNNLISGIILLSVIILLLKKNTLGWYFIAGELILGGSGGYFALGSLSLRTLLLITSVSIFFIQQGKNNLFFLKKYRTFTYLLIFLFSAVFIGFLRGFLFSHTTSFIIADSIPYLFFLYFFPLQQLLLSEQFKTLACSFIYAAIIGNCLFIIFTFTGFALHLFSLQGDYYHWYRDVALGKITDAGANFFRIVINEHLLLIPLFLFFFTKIITTHYRTFKKNFVFYIPFLCLFILTINLTRIYFIALATGILGAFHKNNWKNWLSYSVASFLIFIISFVSINLLLSHGKSYGLELLGLKIHSITRPSMEESSLSRLLLLPKIKEKITEHLFLGSGLGTTIAVYSPVLKKDLVTPHFDWGYLEILAELGLIGLVTWFFLIGYVLKKIIQMNYEIKRASLMSLIALLIINITSPALFHVLGILWIVVLLSFAVSLNSASAHLSQPPK